MTIYILILVFLLFCSLLNRYVDKGSREYYIFIVLSFALLALLGGLRKDVGVDYESYMELFKLSEDLYIMKERGFIWIVTMFHKYHLPFYVFCSLFAVLSVLLAFRFIVNNSPYVFFSILMYFSLGNYYFSTFNGMRQALATVIFLNLLPAIKKKYFLRYLIVLLLTAWFVHFSVILLIPLFFFLRKDWSYIYHIILFGIIVIFNSILLVIIESSPYAIYLAFENFATEVPFSYYLFGLFGLLILFYSMRNSEWRKKNIMFVNLNYIILILLYLLFVYENTPLVMVINRIVSYFTLIYVVLIPKLFYESKISSNRTIFIVVGSSVLAFLCYWALSQNGIINHMIPYKTIFS